MLLVINVRYLQIWSQSSVVASMESVVSVSLEEVEHHTQFQLTKLGSQVLMDCTDFTHNSPSWSKAGQSRKDKNRFLTTLKSFRIPKYCKV